MKITVLGRGKVGRGGVVRDPALHRQSVKRIARFAHVGLGLELRMSVSATGTRGASLAEVGPLHVFHGDEMGAVLGAHVVDVGDVGMAEGRGGLDQGARIDGEVSIIAFRVANHAQRVFPGGIGASCACATA